MKKVMLVFGTRPEAIKMCPLVNELKNKENIETIVCVTGQHRQMLDQVLETFNVVPDYDLSIMKDKQTLFDITTNILNRIKEVLEQVNPDVVLVHGDTSTTFVTALACFYLHIPVGHVEAGLRTYDIESPFPEEFNRQAVSIVYILLFGAPLFLFICFQFLRRCFKNEYKSFWPWIQICFGASGAGSIEGARAPPLREIFT